MLISYAEDFVSYLIAAVNEKYIEKGEIRNIILYGSVVRGDYADKSDIDIFVDLPEPDELKADIGHIVKGFYDSVWFEKWKKLGIKNSISVLVGNLDDWEDLKRSIISNSIILYGSYFPKVHGKPMVLFSVGAIRPESKRVFVNRKLFGYKRYGRKYAGLVGKYNGEKTGRAGFMVPMQHSKEVLDFLKKQQVETKIREIVVI
jgi:predicted nucleotidyltransferase